MKRLALAAGLAAVGFLAAAPPAQADVGAYLDYFHGDAISWSYGPQRLVDEGYGVCQAFDRGMGTTDAVRMVDAAEAHAKPKIQLPKSISTHLELEDVELSQLIAKAQFLLGFPFPVPI